MGSSELVCWKQLHAAAINEVDNSKVASWKTKTLCDKNLSSAVLKKLSK